MQGFTVTLNSEEVIDKKTGQTLAQFLGRGHVVDIIKDKSTFQFESTETHVIGFDDKGEPLEKEVRGVRSIETSTIRYLVLWEGNPEPKIHDSKTINWEMTDTQYAQKLAEETEDEDEARRVVFYTTGNGTATELTEDLYEDIESFYNDYPDATFIGFVDEDEELESEETISPTETESDSETLS